MKRTWIIILFIFSIINVGCEKTNLGDGSAEEKENSTNNKDETNGDSPPIEGDSPSTDGDYLTCRTVAEAINIGNGNLVIVKGYIVASCRTSFKNYDFEAPFTGSSAIIISDYPFNKNELFDDGQKMTICLTDNKHIRENINLEDNPQLWNKQITITGYRATYLSRPGLKNIFDYSLEQ